MELTDQDDRLGFRGLERWGTSVREAETPVPLTQAQQQQAAQERLAQAVRKLCRSEHWQTVHTVLMEFIGEATAQLLGVDQRGPDDLLLTRLQARARGATEAYNEFARLDKLAGEIETNENQTEDER